MKELKLPSTKLKGVTTNWDPSITGKTTGLVGRISEKWTNSPEFYMELHCIIYQ
jgi:hypothetical protein